jgi:hypothetical protein
VWRLAWYVSDKRGGIRGDGFGFSSTSRLPRQGTTALDICRSGVSPPSRREALAGRFPSHLHLISMSQSAQAITVSELTPISPVVSLPPFRSTNQFPRNPKAEQLASLYANCFQALKEANTARSILKARMDEKKRMIGAIRREIERLEQDLSLEAGTRARLHAMNVRLLDALRKMDGLAGELDEVVSEGHRVPRSHLRRLIERLKALVHQWRAFKRRERRMMTGGDAAAQDGGRDA